MCFLKSSKYTHVSYQCILAITAMPLNLGWGDAGVLEEKIPSPMCCSTASIVGFSFNLMWTWTLLGHFLNAREIIDQAKPQWAEATLGLKGRKRIRPYHMELTSRDLHTNPGNHRNKESLNALGWEWL